MKTLRLFADVARLRSISRAADEHGITQSAASQRISALEKQVDVQLIDRSVRPLALTPAGEVFLEGCRDVLERYDQLQRRVCQLRPQLAGEVRVDAIYSAGIGLLNHAVDRFRQEQPDVEVKVEYRPVNEVYDVVARRDCDFGIVSYPESNARFGVIPLRDEVMAVVCGPDHELAGRNRLSATDLDGRELLTFDSSLPVGRQIRRYLKEAGAKPRITNHFDNIDTLKSAVALTDGLSILPTRTVLREVAAHTLRAIELTPSTVRPIGMIYARDKRKSKSDENPLNPAAQAFADFLVAHAGPNVDLVDEQEARGRQLVRGKV
ncbi:MAG: LysR family transcriptional regulator [Phycisphaeraceae bacterium]|nr:LysR family transcriptional regulator [Phycisphaeraceae bacterium]